MKDEIDGLGHQCYLISLISCCKTPDSASHMDELRNAGFFIDLTSLEYYPPITSRPTTDGVVALTKERDDTDQILRHMHVPENASPGSLAWYIRL
jgi:hypothetical protein